MGIKLMAGFLTVVVLLLVLSVHSLRISRKAMEESVGGSTVFLAEETLKRIDQSLYRRIEDLQVFTEQSWLRLTVSKANIPNENFSNGEHSIDGVDGAWKTTIEGAITSPMLELVTNDLSQTMKSRFLSFYEYQYGYNVFSEVFITNANGVNIAQTGTTSDYHQADESWWRTAKDAGVSVSDLAYDDSAETYGVSIGIRIDDGAGNFIGIIKAVADMKGITREAELISRKYTTTRILLTTNDGRLIYSTKPYKFMENVSGTNIFKQIGIEDGFFISEVGGIAMLFSYARSKGYRSYEGLGWILMIGHDADEVFQPISVLRNQIMAFSALVLAAGICLSLFISHTLSASIRVLIQSVNTIGQGNLTHRVTINTNDEIGELATAFNLMAERRYQAEEELRTHRDHLDDLELVRK